MCTRFYNNVLALAHNVLGGDFKYQSHFHMTCLYGKQITHANMHEFPDSLSVFITKLVWIKNGVHTIAAFEGCVSADNRLIFEANGMPNTKILHMTIGGTLPAFRSNEMLEMFYSE